ncbi:MAG: hypothetical protein HOQ03_06845, partial [Thermoleophilia bacterium]|nr:hypothetical protein [Thermoleophilia bacterium]
VTPLTRSRLLQLAGLAAGAFLVDPRAALGRVRAPSAAKLSVRNVGRRYSGDRRYFASVSPGVKGRDRASIRFLLDRPATVRLEALRTALRQRTVVWQSEQQLPAGRNRIWWKPDPKLPVGSYVMRLTVEDDAGNRKTYGGRRPATPSRSTTPVIRVLGVEAAFEKRSYAPGEPVQLTITADCERLTLQFLACGTESEYTDRTDEMRGHPIGPPLSFGWKRKRSAPYTVTLTAPSWPSGVYAAKLTTEDGRLGFAPLILRPVALGTSRQAVVMPTNTWQAYNFDDSDGDGWGDTWYAGGTPPVRLNRPYRQRGTPPWFRRSDVPFLKFVRQTGKTPDFLAEDDLEAFPSGDELRRLYDLVVFPGHTEYVTQQAYDVVQRFRDLGGRLIFLSANNFFWRVDKSGQWMRRVKLWRDLGRPESALIGVQYRANDNGSRQGPFTILDAAGAPWLFAGTGLQNGSTLGQMVGGYGIEIDAATQFSPPGTRVLARIPDLMGPGLSGEMSYYETAAGARVFAAGVLDFGGSITFQPVWQMLENLWRHMTSP